MLGGFSLIFLMIWWHQCATFYWITKLGYGDPVSKKPSISRRHIALNNDHGLWSGSCVAARAAILETTSCCLHIKIAYSNGDILQPKGEKITRCKLDWTSFYRDQLLPLRWITCFLSHFWEERTLRCCLPIVTSLGRLHKENVIPRKA